MSLRIALLSVVSSLVLVGSLRAEEEPAWEPLFNGQDLTGWQVIDGPESSWAVKDEKIVCTGQGGGWLSTAKEYGDFELSAEFRLPEGGNSGVFIRSPHSGDPAYVGMEVQLLDDDAPVYRDLKDWQFTGSVYGVVAARRGAVKPAGEWQHVSVRCQGSQVRVELNGEEIVDADLADHQDKAESHPGILREKGYLGFQNHGSELEFRNVRIREL